MNTHRNRLINIPVLDATGAPRFLGTVFAGRDHIRPLMAKCDGNNSLPYPEMTAKHTGLKAAWLLALKTCYATSKAGYGRWRR